MKETLQKLKKYVIIFISGIVAGILIYFKIQSDEDQEDLVDSAVLDNDEKHLADDINNLKDDLEDIEAGDLSDDQVKDFWNDL